MRGRIRVRVRVRGWGGALDSGVQALAPLEVQLSTTVEADAVRATTHLHLRGGMRG